ncbi:MAG: hypothetical protein ACF8PG_06855, partial [Maioricimonas sp. JB045]
MEERIFVSGLGAVTCLGNSDETLWRRMLEVPCGNGQLLLIDLRGLASTCVGEVDGNVRGA